MFLFTNDYEIQGAEMQGSKLKNFLIYFIGLYVVALIGIFINLTWDGDGGSIVDYLLASSSSQASVSPFLDDDRKPRRSYVRDRNLRDSVLRLEFNISHVSSLSKNINRVTTQDTEFFCVLFEGHFYQNFW